MVAPGTVRGKRLEDGTGPLNAGCSPFLRGVPTISHFCSSVGNTRETVTFWKGASEVLDHRSFNQVSQGQSA